MISRRIEIIAPGRPDKAFAPPSSKISLHNLQLEAANAAFFFIRKSFPGSAFSLNFFTLG
ncbi:hypothetical protein D6T91_05465 [Salmonella enterica subsp. houtenae]|nr:hypothetical protein [Salmonella enterica]EDO5298329.1 hypothetical protein [Salmonella enterica subsp. houtenae serovar 40:z4,z24:-]MCR5945457.1 hypothetical protein [Salmonella enterica subsp. houtenae]